MIRHAVAGVLAAALMIVARLALNQSGLPHYPQLLLQGAEGLRQLGETIVYGAGYGLLFGWLVRPVLPAGLVTPALIFTLVPFIVDALALPLWQGRKVSADAWPLLYSAMHYFIFSLGLVFLGGKSGSKSKDE